jgi:hypothetical protein
MLLLAGVGGKVVMKKSKNFSHTIGMNFVRALLLSVVLLLASASTLDFFTTPAYATTGVIGGSFCGFFSLYGDIVTFDNGTSSPWLLNYFNLTTQELTATNYTDYNFQPLHSLYESSVANLVFGSVGDMGYYDLSTGDIETVYMAGYPDYIDIIDIIHGLISWLDFGARPISTYGNITAFISANRQTEEHQAVFSYIDRSTGNWFNISSVPLEREAFGGVSIYQDIVAFSNSTVCYYNLTSGTIFSTMQTGKAPSICGDIIAFTNGSSIMYYNMSNGQTTLVASGNYPSLFQDTIVFSTNETATDTDLDGDGDSTDWVIRYYDIGQGTIVNTMKVGINPSLYGSTIVYSTKETWLGVDINQNGYTSDSDHAVMYMSKTPTNVHDIAVYRIKLSSYDVIPGQSVSIDVIFENQGDYTENFNVIAYANSTIIGTVANITLASGNLTTVNFNWDTAGIPLGSYTISAQASIVAGENDTSDNILVDGTVLVRSGFHDIAVTNVETYQNLVYAGEIVSIYVTIENQGDFMEAFNVTTYADGVVGTFTGSISRRTFIIVTFTWNTSNSALGTHTLWAQANTVPGETDTSDNTLVDGDILIQPAVHDVAITDVRTSYQLAYAGDNASIYADVWNMGAFSEIFNVTAQADEDPSIIGDEIIVGCQEVSLQSRGTATLQFKWNTTGISLGNYTISAVASNVPQEMDLTNNLCMNGEIEIFAPIPCPDINITCPTTLTVNPSIFTYDGAYQARLIDIGNVSIKSTGFQGSLRALGSNNGTIRLCVNQPDVDAYMFNLPLNGEVQIPLWLMFQPETHWETYNGNFTLQLAICGTHRKQLEIVGISILVCQNGAYVVYNETATFTWNLTGGSWVYLEAEPNLPPGWSYSVDPPISALFETPHIVTVNITAPPDAKEGDTGSITLRAYKNSSGTMFWQFIYFASTDNKSPTIEAIQPPALTYTGDLLFNTTVKDKSGIRNVQLCYSVNYGPWSNVTMQWESGDTFNSTHYTSTIPHVPDNSIVQYYVAATDWFGNQTQSDVWTITVLYDMAVTNLETEKTVVGQGFVIQINTTIANQGTLPNASVKVIFYADAMPIHIQVLPLLENEMATTVVFDWNTTGVAKGNYTIAVHVVPILDETDKADNTYGNGSVIVSIIGDIVPDGTVDIFDLVYAAMSFGAEYGKPPPPGTQPYAANADINGDDIIDIFDIVTVALHYGETDP